MSEKDLKCPFCGRSMSKYGYGTAVREGPILYIRTQVELPRKAGQWRAEVRRSWKSTGRAVCSDCGQKVGK